MGAPETTQAFRWPQAFEPGRDLVTLSYEELREVVGHWLDAICLEIECRRESGAVHASARAEIREQQLASAGSRRASALLARRGFEQFTEVVKPASSLQRALHDLFLSSRLQRHVLAYASMQEGRDWDSATTPYPHTSALLRRTLNGLGKVSMVAVVIRWRGTIRRCSLDPLRYLRTSYALHLRLCRRPDAPILRRGWWRLRRGTSNALFKALCLVGAGVAAATLRYGSRRASAASLPALLRSGLCRDQIANSLRLLFPTSRQLQPEEWRRLLDRVTDYLCDVLPTLLRVMPSESKQDNGVAKLVKLAFGVIAGRVSERARHEPDEVEFIFNSVRLAYSWGITYPLVDNVIDSAATSDAGRFSLLTQISAIFEGHVPAEAGDAPADAGREIEQEVALRLSEVMSLLRPDSGPAARRTLSLLLAAHQHDSQRRLSDTPTPVPIDEERRVWVDAVLKAALVRAATLQICGAELTPAMLSDQIVSGVVNQFGDDLWDVREDIADDRVTPFTLGLTRQARRDPYVFFTQYCSGLSRAQAGPRCDAMHIGILETARCFVQALPAVEPDGMWAEAGNRLTRALREIGVDDAAAGALRAVPHVDLDAVVFGLAACLLGQNRR